MFVATEETVPLLRGRVADLLVSRNDTQAGTKQGLIADYVTDTIRWTEPTPIAEVAAVVGGQARTILLKLDGCSRWGSIKGRTALALLASIASRIDSRTTVVESTSGNLGVALSGICRDLGIPFTAVVDSRLPSAMSARLTDYGARLVAVEPADDTQNLQRRIARVREILDDDPHAVWTNQYENPANVAAHRWWTGPELGRQLDPGLQVVFAPVSTGGTFSGLRDYLSAERPEVTCAAVDVRGSIIFGGPPGHRLLTGIGSSRLSAFIGERSRPPHEIVSDVEAIATCRTLAHDAGIGVGGSSGATIAGCLRFLSERPDLTVALCLCPDMASNYSDTLYNDAWLARAGVTDAEFGRLSIAGQQVHFTRKPRTGDRDLAMAGSGSPTPAGIEETR